MLRPELAALCLETPLVLQPNLEALTAFQTFFGQTCVTDTEDLFAEANFYALATKHVPSWIIARERGTEAKQNAAALYGPSDGVAVPPHVSLPWQCEPELYTIATRGHPAFSGELKSAGTGQAAFNEVLTYILFGMFHSHFSAASATQRFYQQPPVGYGLVAFQHCGYLLGVEWVGKLLLYPISQPFFLGSEAHRAAIDALPDRVLSDCIELDVGSSSPPWATYPAVGPVQVSWTTAANARGRFAKLIQCTAFDKHPQGGVQCFRQLFATYAAYSTAFRTHAPGDPPPAALLEARLLFGPFAVLVDMPFVGSRECTDDELKKDGPVLGAVVEAMAWLGRHRLLYVDLRARNVRLDPISRGVFLVDYDDMVVVSHPLTSGTQLAARLRAHTRDTGCACALDIVPGLGDMLERQSARSRRWTSRRTIACA